MAMATDHEFEVQKAAAAWQHVQPIFPISHK